MTTLDKFTEKATTQPSCHFERRRSEKSTQAAIPQTPSDEGISRQKAARNDKPEQLLKKLNQSSKGQSLVELAVIMPILIFMMLGVFEVGWVLRNYLTMVNLNRELARFAIRPATLDFSLRDPEEVGYDNILTHTTTVSGQLGTDFETNSTLVISHIVVDTGLPCLRGDLSDPTQCDCSKFTDEGENYGADQLFTYDDIILHPDVPGYNYFTFAFPTTTITASDYLTNVSRFDFSTKAEALVRQNNKLNCEFAQRQALSSPDTAVETSPNNLIIVEINYEQPQLFGFPVISNPFTDPVPLYSQTTMRLVAGARSAQGTQSTRLVGPVCKAYPWYVQSGFSPVTTTLQSFFDGWVKWGAPDYGESDEEYIYYGVVYPQMAMNEYETGGDKVPIAVGREVTTLPGTTVVDTDIISNINGILNQLGGQRVVIPVLSGSTIDDFIEIELVANDSTTTYNDIPADIQGYYRRSVADGDLDDLCLPAIP